MHALNMTTVPQPVTKNIRFFALGIAIAAGLAVWMLPIPQGVEVKAWKLLAVFVGLILALIGKALPMGALSFLALTLLIVTHTLTMKQAFSGFANPLIWLVVAAFLLSRSFIKTGLGMRIAYLFVGKFGKHTLGLGYSFTISELLLAPVIPSNTARAGGILYPIIRALSISFGSTPEKHSQRRMGSFLILNAYYSNLITSAMFVTAMAANPLIVAMMQEHGLVITWGQWALAALVPGLISLAVAPYVVYWLYPPKIIETPQAEQIAKKHLKEMGVMSSTEKITLGVFALLIVLWMFGEHYLGIESTTVAFVGVSALVLTGVLTWNDIKHEHEAWDTLIWFSTLVMMATYLNEFGLIKWISQHIQYLLGDTPWWIAWPLLVLIYFYSHYLFASNTAHVTSMYAAFLSVGIALQVPPYLIALSLAFSSSLFACITHYGTGCAAILFGSEYVDLKTWWRIGAIISILFLFLWIGLGSVWWKIIGLW